MDRACIIGIGIKDRHITINDKRFRELGDKQPGHRVIPVRVPAGKKKNLDAVFQLISRMKNQN
jgi:hypothetical protein